MRFTVELHAIGIRNNSPGTI